MGHIYPIPSKY